jgi:probable O-glycosylation ligase (exosortase A-associated)
MIRDLILLAALCATVPLILRAPIVGLLVWVWVALMNPHQEVYGFLRGFPLNWYVCLITAAAWLVSRERKLVPPNLSTGLLVLFALWATVSTFFALDHTHAVPLWERTMKTIILGLAVATLANTRIRVQAVVWTVVVSIGYYAVKGGGFVLLTGGHSHVFGPESSMIEDNNALGLAMILLLPLIHYLRVSSARASVRWALLGMMALTLVAIFGTYSRGALIALLACGAAFSVRSRYGLAAVLVGALLAVNLPSILPPSWFERMSTIQSANQDSSFESRVSAWRTSLNIAMARPLVGGGFLAVEQDWVAKAFPSPGSLAQGRAAHSVYFEVLGETGFIGLALYLSVVAAAAMNTFRVLAIARGQPALRWAGELARMLQVSMVGFLAGGAALSMAYYDGAIVLFALTASLLQVVRNPGPAGQGAFEPLWKRAPPAVAATTKWRSEEPAA